jgi:voltage-gated potassium channel
MCMWFIYYATRVALLKHIASWHQVTLLADCLILIVVYFATIYSLIHANGNFNIPLSRVDAIYFSLGMLTTAGTGNIVPQSELARGIVSIQMVFDFIFVAVTVVIAINNLSERWRK